jgi:cell division protease FtsH
MLVEMDGFDANEGVIIIAATNRPDVLDPALLRPGRFDRQIYVDLPTLKGREDILKLHGAKIKFAANADLSRIARGTPGFSGADLANLLNEAALLAVRKNLDGVTQEMLEEARDKVLWGRERKSSNLTDKDREITAWHEAGHALLQLLLPNADPLHKVTIIPRGRALGATMALPEKDILNRTKGYFLDEICICCGGRIAEKIKTGDISTGAAQDIRQATAIARDMICSYGMSDNYGFQAFVEPSQFTAEPQPPPFSQKTAEGIDAEVKKLVDEAYARAEKLIGENREKLETLAKSLLEKESMDGRDIEELLGFAKPESEKPADADADGKSAGAEAEQEATTGKTESA